MAGLPLLLAAGLLTAAGGLRLIPSDDFNCSQPGLLCSVASSNCLDLSWIRPYRPYWTPAAPATVEVTAATALNERGERVPVLNVSWSVSIDASIVMLQGAELSVLEVGSGLTRCIQFQFGNAFPDQQDQNSQAWKFFYSNFEVNPGNKYQISVQHLPKKETFNRKEREFTAPGCGGDEMMQTDTCCKLGHCWKPNITLEFIGTNLAVIFTPWRDAQEYGVQVSIGPLSNDKPFFRVALPEGATTERVQVNFSNPVTYEPCWYNVSVWPYMPSCGTDCRRQWYAPKCLPIMITTPAPPGPGYVWPMAAAVTVVAFAVTVFLLWQFRACVSPAVDKSLMPPPPVAPPLVKQKVWLIYSADHELYINAVFKLADFLRVAWGLDVVLDRHQYQEIGIKGAMTWLSYQKEQIEKVNGTILLLCSRGTQAKWRAMQNRQEARVRLPEDERYVFGDLFTPALALILPDFQKANPYDRYVVAYFGDLCNVGDIPSPLEICPRYALTENLQLLLFRIQRIEQQQPNLQYNVDLKGEASYQHLVKAIDQCRTWQETCPDWLVGEYSPVEAKHEEEEAGPELTRRVYPQIRRPETSVSMLTPSLIEPNSIKSVNPSLVVGPSSVCVLPLLNEELPLVTVVQPSLKTEALKASYRQQPYLVDESIPICNERLHQLDLSNQDIQSEDLSEAQKRLFCQNVSQILPDLGYPVMLSTPAVEELTVNDPLLPIDLSTPCEQSVPALDLEAAQKKFFCQSILGNQSGAPGIAFEDESPFSSEDRSVYEYLRQIDLSIQRDQNISDLREAQRKFFYQTMLGDQHFAPNMVFDAEHQPLLVGADLPLPTLNKHLHQSDGRNVQSTELRETQNNWLAPSVLAGQGVTLITDAHADKPDIHEDNNNLYQDFEHSEAVVGWTGNLHCPSEDMGYGSWRHNELEAAEGE